MFYPELRQRIDQRIGHRRHRADAAGFARALGADQMVLVGTGLAFTSIEQKSCARGTGVVHERPRRELATAVEVDVLF